MSQSGFFDIGAQRIEYRWLGGFSSVDDPTIVLLHEGLGCVALWRDFPEKLAEATGLGVLLYSRSGYGASSACELPRPLDFMHHEALDVLPGVLEAANIDNAILVGHSDGGSISLIHAGVGQGSRIKAVVTIAAHVFNEDISVASIAEAKVMYDEGNLRLRLEKYHGDNVDCAFRGWNDVWLHPDFRSWNIEDVLKGVTQPLLAIQGTEDQYGSELQIDAIVGQVSGSVEKYMISDSKHSPHLEKQADTVTAIAKFLDGVVKKETGERS